MILLKGNIPHEFMQPFTADIQTIAYALSHINRYTGHVGTYSVAQHCVLVANQLPENLKLSGLLHDAPEAYIGDVSAPLKKLIPEYRNLENFYHDEIDRQFNVDTRNPIVTNIDLRMLITEALSFGMDLSYFQSDIEPYYFYIRKWDPEYARLQFLDMFHSLTKGCNNG